MNPNPDPKKANKPPQPAPPQPGNQGDTSGEGNYDASRRYREGLEQSVQEGEADKLAKKAREALEGPQGDELRRADEKGKRAQTPGRS